MNVNVISTTDNKLLDRKEINAEITFEGATPKRAELKQAIGGKIGANPDLLVLRRVSSKFGSKSVLIAIHVYAKKESMMSIEPKHILIRDGFMQKQKKKAAPAAKPAKKKK